MDFIKDLQKRQSARFNNFHTLINALMIIATNIIVIILLIKNRKISEVKGQVKDTITAFTFIGMVTVLVVFTINVYFFLQQKKICIGKCNTQLIFLGSLCLYLLVSFVQYLMSVIGIFSNKVSLQDNKEYTTQIITFILLIILTFSSLLIALQTFQRPDISLFKKILEFGLGPFFYACLVVYLGLILFA